MPIPPNIHKNHVIKAVERMNHMSQLRPSTKFDFVYNGRRYPPKEVLRIANQEANEVELHHFSGGDESNNYLIRLGFSIALKGTNDFIEIDYTKKKRAGIQATFKGKEEKDDRRITIPDDFNLEIEKTEITETEKEYLTKTRIGHSIFKKVLLQLSKKCKICGMEDERFLIASHIKPWCVSNNQERLDFHNGLLLCPNHDSLFDKGSISFDTQGKILISTLISEETQIFLNISKSLHIKMSEEQMIYMKWHRKNRFID